MANGYRQTIRVSDLSGEIEREMVAVARPLQPGSHDVMVEQVGDEHYILDGFHRVAGYLAYGTEDDQIEVIVVTDEDLAADVAEPGPRQADAINTIIETI